MSSVDTKGVYIFLAITFGLTLAIYLTASMTGFAEPANIGFAHLAGLVVILYVPALAAAVTARIRGDRLAESLRVRAMPWSMAAVAIIGFPALFFAMYAVMSLLGAASADWQLTLLAQQLPQPQEAGLEQALPPMFLLLTSLGLSVVLGPTLYALAVAGHEFGWRSYLFNKLEPLGLVRAHVVTGLLWALWLSPIVILGYAGGDDRVAGLTSLVLMAIFAGAIFNEVWRRSAHVGLTAIWAGCFASQLHEGVWRYLFPDASLPLAGPFGLVAIVFWGVTALALLFLPESYRFAQAPSGTGREAPSEATLK